MSITAVANEWLGALFPGRDLPSKREAAADILESAALRLGPEARRNLNLLARSIPRHAQPLEAVQDSLKWCDDALCGLAVLPENSSLADIRISQGALRKAEAILARRG